MIASAPRSRFPLPVASGIVPSRAARPFPPSAPFPVMIARRLLTAFSQWTHSPGRLAWAALALAFCLTASSAALAQTAEPGTVTGRVSNAATQKYLMSAEVIDQVSRRSVYTDADGSFSLSLPAGERTLVVNYGGLDSRELRVDIVAGETTLVDVALTSADYAPKEDVVMLAEYVVSAEREGRMASIAQQKASEVMVSVLSSDEFPNVAGANLGDFLRNIPGIDIMDNGSDPRDVMIRGMDSQMVGVTSDGMRMANAAGTDGNTRAFNLDQISIQNYETIEVYKTPTAAMAADSGAGSINLVSKSAFNLKERRITYQAGGMVNGSNMHLGRTRGSGGNVWSTRPVGSYYYANSFLENRLGVVLTANYNDIYTVNETATGNRRTLYDRDATVGAYHPSGDDYGSYLRSMNYSYGTGITRRTSLSANFDYKLTPDIKLYVNTQVNTSYINGGSQSLSTDNQEINSSVTEGGAVSGLMPHEWITNDQGYLIPTWRASTATVITGSNDIRANTLQDVANSKGPAVSTGLEILNKIGHGTMFSGGAEYKRGAWKVNLDGGISQSTNHYTTPDGLEINTATAYLRGIDYRIDYPAGSDFPILTQLNGPDLYDLANYVGRAVGGSNGPLVSVPGTNRNVPTSAGTSLVIPGVSTDRTYPNVQMARGNYGPFQVSNGRWLNTKDKFTTAKLDAKRSFFAPVPGFIQVGGLIRQNERRTDKNGQTRYIFNGTTDELHQLLEAVKSPDLNATFGPYQPVPYFSMPYIDQYFRANRSKFTEDVVWRTETERTGDKFSQERVDGGYAMLNFKIWGLSTLLGARYERTLQSGRGQITDNDAAAARAAEMLMAHVRSYGYADITAAYNDTAINPVTGVSGRQLVTNYTVNQAQALELTELRFAQVGNVNKAYDDWFPNVQLKYNLTKNLIARASYNKSIARQPFDRLLPGYTVTSSSEGFYTVTMNNPSLKPIYFDNYDFAIEHYTKKGGSASIGYFFKDVQNFTANTTETITADGDYDYDLSSYVGGALERPVNIGGAKHWGIETSFSQRLGVFADVLKDFQLYATYTYQEGKTNSSFNSTDPVTGLSDRPAYMPVRNFVPKKFKVNLNYRRPTWDASVSYNWTSDYMTNGPWRIAAGTEPEAFVYLYRAARGTVDVAASCALYKKNRLYVEVKNLTNEPVRTYLDRPGWQQNYNRYGAFVYFGIKGSF